MLSIVIQAGGESKRMGRDKALLPFCGQPLISHVIGRLNAFEADLLVTTNHPKDFSFLGLPLAEDILPGKGALGGLYTALAVTQNPLVVVVACDMPFVNPQLLSAELKLLDESGADVIIPTSPRGYEPMHAVYSRENCMIAVESALEAGRRRMISWFPEVNVTYMSEDEVAHYDPDFLAFSNVNTPQEFLKAEAIACGGGG
jgi:molybdopterin-guanine dinucleotide biosynthesis protein A